MGHLTEAWRRPLVEMPYFILSGACTGGIDAANFDNLLVKEPV
jgi:hypothetical protein